MFTTLRAFFGFNSSNSKVPGRKARRKFADLLSHKEEMKEVPSTRRFVLRLRSAVSQILGPSNTPCHEDFFDLYGRLLINGFEIADERQRTKGWGLYLAPSLLDHSCVPNTTVSFSGKTLRLRTLVDIPEEVADGDVMARLYISYIDLMEHTEVRREKLERNYFFHCQCMRCVGKKLFWHRPTLSKEEDKLSSCYWDRELADLGPESYGAKPKTEAMEKLLYSIRCQGCSGRPVYVGHGRTREGLSPTECSECGQVPSEETLQQYLEALREVNEILEEDEVPIDAPAHCLK